MPPSFRNINYRLRPAKAVERKMMCEAFTRLSTFRPLTDYQYVGMGSPFFTDFILVHRHLGINAMTSIEKEVEYEDRFRFNLPFGCIDLRFGESSDVLLEIPLQRPSIVWLDFDGRLTRSVLADLETVLSSVPAGSIVALSINAHPHTTRQADPNISKIRLDELVRSVGRERVPIDVTGDALLGWGTADVYYRILSETFRTILEERSAFQRLKFRQIFHFRYEDGAKMLTLGGVVAGDTEQQSFELAAFDKLPFYRSAREPFTINVPHLTFREMRYLDRHLPGGIASIREAIEGDVFLESDINAYASIYRYFPMFAETDL